MNKKTQSVSEQNNDTQDIEKDASIEKQLENQCSPINKARPSSWGGKTCYSFQETASLFEEKFNEIFSSCSDDECEFILNHVLDESEVTLNHDSWEFKINIYNFIELYICKLIFLGHIDAGIKKSDGMIDPLYDFDIYYKDFGQHLKYNLARIPLDSIMILPECDNENPKLGKDINNIYSHFRMMHEIGDIVLLSLVKRYHPTCLGDLKIPENDATQILPITIKGDVILLSITSKDDKIFLFCKNQREKTRSLPFPYIFYSSFSPFFKKIDLRKEPPSFNHNRIHPTFFGLIDSFFILFLKSHGIFNKDLFHSSKKTTLDDNNDFIDEVYKYVLEFFFNNIYIKKESLNNFLNIFNIRHIKNYYDTPEEPFKFSYKKTTINNNLLEKLKKILTLVKDKNSASQSNDIEIIQAAIDIVTNNLSMETVHSNYAKKILNKNKNEMNVKSLWNHIQRYTAKIAKQFNIVVELKKFSHKKSDKVQ